MEERTRALKPDKVSAEIGHVKKELETVDARIRNGEVLSMLEVQELGDQLSRLLVSVAVDVSW